MNNAKKNRFSEAAVGILLLAAFALTLTGFITNRYYLNGLGMIREAVSATASLMFIIGKFRTPPWNRITGALFIIAAAVTAITFVKALKTLISTDFAIFRYAPLMMTVSLIHSICFIAGGFICAFIYLGVIHPKNRLLYTVLLYILIIISAASQTLNRSGLYADMIIVFGLCFAPESSDTPTKRGRVGRAGIWIFCIMSVILAFSLIYVSMLGFTAIHYESGDSPYEQAVTAVLVLTAVLYAGLLLSPLSLGDKRFGSNNDNDENKSRKEELS